MAQGPDTLAQTAQSMAIKPLADGAGHTFRYWLSAGHQDGAGRSRAQKGVLVFGPPTTWIAEQQLPSRSRTSAEHPSQLCTVTSTGRGPIRMATPFATDL